MCKYLKKGPKWPWLTNPACSQRTMGRSCEVSLSGDDSSRSVAHIVADRNSDICDEIHGHLALNYRVSFENDFFNTMTMERN